MMNSTELVCLEKLTAITLTEEETPVFLEYFGQMKEMFEEFRDTRKKEKDTSFEVEQEDWWERGQVQDLSLQTFTTTKITDPEPILANVLPERLYDHSIEVEAVF